ncbi:V-set and transmembrane domain-containing protein 2-like protein [Hemicordylus capensis]|uniref:V-set and transmembrane domain-containing protein 2-like protein n=1 Tax=Hemicordylus capensis TaxID=884348 RepID=UPI002302C4D5|nr:V-set and transmembrane domain-containing protein 2-like protein [Hemicordylus capensis]
MGGAFGLTLALCHSVGLYLQLGASSRPPQWENQLSGNAFFTETPHDMTARAGEDVEMACSFRGNGSPSYSLEIQWWYVRTHRDWTDKQNWASDQLKASPQEEAGKDATKISVVKVVGSNISHKLRLSRVKPTDEGTYECRVIDFSDSKARHHRVKAYLRVEPEEPREPHRHSSPTGHLQDTQLLGVQLSEPSKLSASHPHPQHHPHKAGKELKKRSVDGASCSF